MSAERATTSVIGAGAGLVMDSPTVCDRDAVAGVVADARHGAAAV
jgi:hypothetical protein